MTVSRNARLLAAALCGLAAMIAAVAAGIAPALLGAFAAVSFIDLLLGTVGIVVTAMTAMAGLLVISDARMDIAGTSAWHDAAAGLTAAVSAVAEPSDESTEKPASDPHAEMVRRILIAHRFDRPLVVPHLIATHVPEPEAGTLEVGQSMRAVRPTMADVEASVCVGEGEIAGSRVIPDRALRLVASKVGGPTKTAVPAKHLAKTKAAAGRSQDSATDGTTTEQPACRGPPRNSGKVALRKKHWPPTKASSEMVVVDDLGERVPISAAELDVIEAYLDHVVRDLLERHRGDKDPGTT